MPERFIDLQTHSIHSDGTFTPEEIVALATEKNLAAVALTDHDTVDGLPAFLQAGQDHDIETIPGIELSTRTHGENIDILGYFIDPHNETLQQETENLRQARRERMPKMLQRLQDEGIHLTLQDIEEHATGDVLGRPHLAKALLEHDHIDQIQDAYDAYIGDHAPAYVPKKRLNPPDAIHLIHQADGLAVLAHPCYIHPARFPLILETLTQAGLDGIETYYPDHDANHVTFFKQQAQRYDLATTGGSDFHGDNKPHINLGTGRGNLRVPYACLEALRKRQDN